MNIDIRTLWLIYKMETILPQGANKVHVANIISLTVLITCTVCLSFPIAELFNKLRKVMKCTARNQQTGALFFLIRGKHKTKYVLAFQHVFPCLARVAFSKGFWLVHFVLHIFYDWQLVWIWNKIHWALFTLSSKVTRQLVWFWFYYCLRLAE